MSTLKQRQWTYVGSTFIFNQIVETTLVHRRWIDVILSTLFEHFFVNVETTSINVRWLTFVLNQILTLKQRWWLLTINVVSTLIQRWCVCCGLFSTGFPFWFFSLVFLFFSFSILIDSLLKQFYYIQNRNMCLSKKI